MRRFLSTCINPIFSSGLRLFSAVAGTETHASSSKVAPNAAAIPTKTKTRPMHIARTSVPEARPTVTATAKKTQPIPMSQALERVNSQKTGLYAKLLLHNFPFTVVPTDFIYTHRMNDTHVGDVLTLTQIREVGSRDFKLCGRPMLPQGAVTVKAVVMEHTHGEKVRARMRKQRKGRRPLKTIKPRITVLRVSDIVIDPQFKTQSLQ